MTRGSSAGTIICAASYKGAVEAIRRVARCAACVKPVQRIIDISCCAIFENPHQQFYLHFTKLCTSPPTARRWPPTGVKGSALRCPLASSLSGISRLGLF
jgi:hypothetical protein